MRNCVAAGIRCVEHGNLIDAETAKLLAEHGTYLVPTLVTYEMLSAEGARHGIPPANIDTINLAREQGLQGLRHAHEQGVKIGSGSDLLGPMHVAKARELAIKAKVLTPMGSLLAATRTNAELFGMAEDIGTVEVGKLADLLVVTGDPVEDVSILQDVDNLVVIMKGGRMVKDRLTG